ncbi:hypothetical protein [Gorillibacterium sp. sgz5001074]|uniref:hypothetical protein n=1 Tax=Gorillibacterium sp. sgz5001074 TaxID=3446695 RepID=UPI003F66F0E6
MTNSEKARKLYAELSTDIKESLLIPTVILENGRVPKYVPYAVGILVRQYAERHYEDDWIPVTPDLFRINSKDREGRKDLQRILDLLERNQVIETLKTGTDTYVRIVEDEVFEPSSYLRNDNDASCSSLTDP